MNKSKFIIGLGTTVPSTRVLKPPGGDSSDLFGLKTRQTALLQSLKKTSSVVTSLKIRELIDKSKNYCKKLHSLENVHLLTEAENIDYDSEFENQETSDNLQKDTNPDSSKSEGIMSYPIKNNEENRNLEINISNYDLRECKGKENLLEYIQHSLPEEKKPAEISSKDSSEKTLDDTKPNALTPNHQPEDTISDCKHSEHESKNFSKHKADVKFSSPKKPLEVEIKEAVNKNANKSKKKSQESNKKLTSKKYSNNKQNNKNLKSSVKPQSPVFTRSQKKVVPKRLCKVVRNPITGVITEMNQDKLCRQLKVIGLNENNAKNYRKQKSDYPIPFKCQNVAKVYIPRNPITGEGTKDDSNYYEFVPRGIRIIQPPGGISYGIY